MDYSQYYKEENGCYCVYFPNRRGLSKDQIKEIFSEFGTVLSVNVAGDQFGYRFVRYQTVDEVISCLEGLKDHPSVKLSVQRKKFNGENSRRSFNNSKGNSPNSTHSNGTQNQLHTQHSLPAIESDVVKAAELKNTNHSVTFSTLIEEQMPSLVPIEHFNLSLSQSSSSSLISNGQLSPKQNIIPAAEVVIANIQPTCSIHYILHLIRKHNPLSISLIKNVRGTSLQYCHVYFEQPEQAAATQMEFDKFTLSGKNLIVLQPNKLMEEANLFNTLTTL